MATITAGDFRNGKTFEMDGKIMQVVEFHEDEERRDRRRDRDLFQPDCKV